MEGARVLIETLGESEDWSVLAVDDRLTEWRSPTRLLPPGGLRLVAQAHERRERVQMRLAGHGLGEHTVSAGPVFGPDGRVHAVQVRIAADGEPLPEPYAVAAFGYSSQACSIRLGRPAFDWPLPRDRSSWTVPEAFRYVERFDGSMELILRTVEPVAGSRWSGDVTARLGHRLRRYRLAVRNGVGAAAYCWRGLIQDITQYRAPEEISLDGAALSVLGQQAAGNGHLVLADARQVRLIRWITDPVPGIQWKGMVDDRDTPHPDDVARILAEVDRVTRDGRTHGRVDGVRLRRMGGGWTVVDAVGTIIPTPDTARLMLLELTVVGSSDDPDPTESRGDE
ncbi:DUF5593 domain-containing protein [Nocardia sp. CDC159]|uniref:DUF5593 domain-containing protein n=1 Tax=Nocardia pulmonis TaxID=2951408 RepID=A0A9X2IV52_9NOCA|nr:MULTISPECIES: GAF domain-containing protein [Nocardia]MCM6773527.1 DUF5593 domain-containing protein [Nocardia pulmonis]MCM6786414.1 DUF5593 domain-containing protein [Nocardia sp. CDC159]